MFGIGGFELFIILVFGFLIFGPDKLPDIAKTVGKGIARFREAQQEMNDTLGGEKIFDPNNADEPFKDPVEVLDRIAQRQEGKKAKEDAAGKPRADAAAAPAHEPSSRVARQSEDGKRPSRDEQAAAEAPAEQLQGESGQPAREEAARGKESFTERKARYERERAARKAADAESAGEPEATEKSKSEGKPVKKDAAARPQESKGGDD